MLNIKRILFLVVLALAVVVNFQNIYAQTKWEPVVSLFNIIGDSDFVNGIFPPGANLPQFSMVDINNDSKPDLFVYDKHSQKGLTYINTGSGEFSYLPAYETVLPLMSDWALFKDYNNDGLPDLWTRNSDYNGVSVFKNITTAKDSFIKFEVASKLLRYYNFSFPIDTSNVFCDKNNIPAITDIDNDGDLDFLTLQAAGLGVTLFLNNCTENKLSLENLSFESPDDCWGYFSEDAFSNDIILQRYPFCRRTYYRYKKHAGGSSLLFLDLNKDGDNDLLMGNAGYRELLMLENGKKDYAYKVDTIISYSKKFPNNNPADIILYPAAYLINLDNEKSDYLIVAGAEADDYSYNVEQKGLVMVYKDTSNNNSRLYASDSSMFVNTMFKDKGAYSSAIVSTLSAADSLFLFLCNNGSKSITRGLTDRVSAYYLDKNMNLHWITDNWGDLINDSIVGMSLAFYDLDNDGLKDVIIGDAFGKLHGYKNTGGGLVKTAWFENFSSNYTYLKPATTSTQIKDYLLLGSKEGPVSCYEIKAGSLPQLVHITDTFGSINNNALVLQSFYDQQNNEWKDTLLPESEGYTSICITQDNDDYLAVCAGKAGQLRYYKPATKGDFLGKFIETEQHSYAYTPVTNYNAGRMATVTDFLNTTTNHQYLIIGNASGGLRFLKKTDKSTSYTKHVLTEFSVFPNPSVGFFKVYAPFKIQSIQVISSSGKLILETSSLFFNLSNEPQGVYFVKISDTQNRTAIKRVIKL